MAKASKQTPIKLPKRLLGVKLPKKSRKRLNRMLKQTSSDLAQPLIAAAVGSLVTMLAERLEKPLEDLVAHSSSPKKREGKLSATH